MRQILLNSGGAVVARVPRPIVERGSVLVRVQYSLISVGTEIAPLRSTGQRRARQLRGRARDRVREPREALLPREPARSAQGDGPRGEDRARPVAGPARGAVPPTVTPGAGSAT